MTSRQTALQCVGCSLTHKRHSHNSLKEPRVQHKDKLAWHLVTEKWNCYVFTKIRRYTITVNCALGFIELLTHNFSMPSFMIFPFILNKHYIRTAVAILRIALTLSNILPWTKTIKETQDRSGDGQSRQTRRSCQPRNTMSTNAYAQFPTLPVCVTITWSLSSNRYDPARIKPLTPWLYSTYSQWVQSSVIQYLIFTIRQREFLVFMEIMLTICIYLPPPSLLSEKSGIISLYYYYYSVIKSTHLRYYYNS